MENKSNIIIVTVIIVTVILGLIAFLVGKNISDNNNYEEAKKMFESGNYYDALYNYYESLNTSNKQKINNLILEKINNTTWKSERQSNYKNFEDCIGNEYVKINNNVFNRYVSCDATDSKEERKYDWGKGNLILSFKESDNSKVVFEINYGSLYLFVYRNNEMNIETSSVDTTNPYNTQIVYHKFNIVKE